MSKCLVFGANGFIGSHLVDSLVEDGHTVKAFDRFKGSNYNFKPNKNIEILSGDFLNRHDIQNALHDVEYVFHFISVTTPIESEDDPFVDIETNLKMSVELFQLCSNKPHIKKVIFASTGGSIYGDSNVGKFNENTIPNPVSPYAICKLATEQYLSYFKKKFGLESVIFRISNPYGERQSPAAKQGVIPIFLKRIYDNEPITVLGDGTMVRDYIYVKDVTLMISKSFASSKHSLYNLGSGHGTSVNNIISLIEEIVGKPINIIHKKNYPTFLDRSVVDITRFKREFQIIPKVDLKTGIQNTWFYINETK